MSIGAGPQISNYPYGFQNGLSVRGLPLEMTYPGTLIWVYNGPNLAPQGAAGSDGNRGSFQRPKATINGALQACVSGRGDIIMVKPGHVETITDTTTYNITQAGVQVIGLGAGNQRPTITISGAGQLTVAASAAGLSFSNIVFNVPASTFGIFNNAPDFGLFGNTFICSATGAGTGPVVCVEIIATADRFTAQGNQFIGPANGQMSSAIRIAGTTGSQIVGNNFYGGWDVAGGAIQNNVTASTNLNLTDNIIQNTKASSTKALVMVAGTTGTLARNLYQILSGTAPVTAAGMSWVGANYYAATVGTIGTLV